MFLSDIHFCLQMDSSRFLIPSKLQTVVTHLSSETRDPWDRDLQEASMREVWTTRQTKWFLLMDLSIIDQTCWCHHHWQLLFLRLIHLVIQLHLLMESRGASWFRSIFVNIIIVINPTKRSSCIELRFLIIHPLLPLLIIILHTWFEVLLIILFIPLVLLILLTWITFIIGKKSLGRDLQAVYFQAVGFSEKKKKNKTWTNFISSSCLKARNRMHWESEAREKEDFC